MPNSSTTTASAKPNKPYADFPLFAHATGFWAKKIRGKIHYFGKWGRREDGKLIRIPGETWQEALALYREQVDDLMAGRTPERVEAGESKPTTRDLCNQFLANKQHKLKIGELSPATFTDYRMACDRLIDHFGKRRQLDGISPQDFARLRETLAEGRSLTTLKNAVNLIRTVFKFAYDQGLIDQPMRFGQSFDRPSTRVLRQQRQAAGAKVFTRDELERILEAADVTIKAMVLLGINCGFGNMDVASLPQRAIDWETGWLEFPRPKTGIERRVKLWPETLQALKMAVNKRPSAKQADDDDQCFLTKGGLRFAWSHTRQNQIASIDATRLAADFPSCSRILA